MHCTTEKVPITFDISALVPCIYLLLSSKTSDGIENYHIHVLNTKLYITLYTVLNTEVNTLLYTVIYSILYIVIYNVLYKKLFLGLKVTG